MDKTRIERLRKAGWRVGSTADFLELTPEDQVLIEMRLALARGLKAHRVHKGWTQAHLARISGSSQSRIAKIEAGDASVSLDLILRCLASAGLTRKEIGRMISRGKALP